MYHQDHHSISRVEPPARCSVQNTLPQFSSADACLQAATQMMDNHTEDLKPTMLRTLQQSTGAPGSEKVVSVATANEFQEALWRGATHVEIREHLDLTNQQAAFYDAPEVYKLQVFPSTLSIRVRPPCALLVMNVDEYTGSSHVASLNGTCIIPYGGPIAGSPALPFVSNLNRCIH
jgi:hypothetical protein